VTTAPLFLLPDDRWHVVKRCDPSARALVDGDAFGLLPHYSRQTPGAPEFMASGKTLVMLTDDARAVWGVIESLEPGNTGKLHWRVSMFRNEGAGVSSELIREATNRTFSYWQRHYGALPPVPLRTEVNPRKVRPKRDPGRCFLRAGWRRVKVHRGLVVLEAPGETERCGCV
jgi:hypothetical protein